MVLHTNGIPKIASQVIGLCAGLTAICFYNKKDGSSQEKKNNSFIAQIDQENISPVTNQKQQSIESGSNQPLNLKTSTIKYNAKYSKLVPKIFKILHEAKEEFGSPGMSFAISHNGNLVMKGGIGLADVENHVACDSETMLRIASISKSLTSLAVGKLIEENHLDIDCPIQKYVPSYPKKDFNGKNVTITVKQILSHTSGIRGYFDGKGKQDDSEMDDKSKRKHAIEKKKYGEQCINSDENFIKKHYDTVEEGLSLFRDDPLIFEPGTGYEYSSLAYSLISRAIETSTGKDYITYLQEMCDTIGLKNTYVDLNDTIIYNRAHNYRRDNGRLKNVAYIDNSYKWSGGGFLSNAEDLLCLGNCLLYAAQTDKGFLKKSTLSNLWSHVPVTKGLVSKKKYPNVAYALGWCEFLDEGKGSRKIFHTGGAVGASSVFFLQLNNNDKNKDFVPNNDIQGTVITIIVNMQSVGLTQTALRIQKCLDAYCDDNDKIVIKKAT